MKFSIRTQLLIAFAFVVALPYLIQLVGFQITLDSIRSQVSSLQLWQAHSAADEIENLIEEEKMNLLNVAQEYRRDVQKNSYSNIIDAVNYNFRQSRFLEKVTIFDLKGKELLKINRSGQIIEKLGNETPTSYFNLAVSGQTGISGVYYPQQQSFPRIDIFCPIFSNEGDILGVLKGEMNLEYLWETISHIDLGESGFAYIIDRDGKLIAHPRKELVLRNRPYAPQAIIKQNQNEISKKDYIYLNERKTEVLANAWRISGLDWVVVFEQTVEEALLQVNFIRNLFLATVFGSFVLFLIVAVFLSESLTQPIRELKLFTAEIQKGNFQKRLTVRTGDEIEDLANSFNLMTAQLEDSVNQLKEKIRELEEQKAIIKAEKDKLTVVLSGINDAVMAVDFERKLILFNSAAERLTDLSAQEVLGKPVEEIIALYDNNTNVRIAEKTYCPVINVGFEGIVFSKSDLKLKVFNSKEKEIFVNLIAGQIKEGKSVNMSCILTLHDVTLERELENMKLDFVSMAAHELRTPLTSIRGYTALLSDETKTYLKPGHKEFLRRLNRSGEILSSLIDNLLNVSRIERGVLKIEPVFVDIVDLTEKVLKGFREHCRTKKQILIFKKPESKIPFIFADPLRINEVLSNLIGNAVIYTPAGGKIEVSIKKKENMLTVTIKDNGPGISPEAIPKLFTKFFRVSGQLEKGVKGTGLGLYISKSIILLHKGKIWVDSQLGKGCAFNFTLPIPNKKEIDKYKNLKYK